MDFSYLFMGKNYPARYYGVIKDEGNYTLWDVRSLRVLVAAKDCLLCSFFVGLLVDQGQIVEVANPAAQRRMDVDFHKSGLNKCCGVLKYRVVKRQDIRGYSSYASPSEEDLATGHQWITVLAEFWFDALLQRINDTINGEASKWRHFAMSWRYSHGCDCLLRIQKELTSIASKAASKPIL